MWTALLSKELRECSLYAALALIVQIHFVGEGMGLPLVSMLSNRQTGEIPFVQWSYSRESTFTTIAIVAAIVLGLHQTIWESWRQTALFLLHRPMPRSQIFLVKIVAGSLLLFGIAGLPLIVYSVWAATPGTHASPFYWGMTESWWRSVGVAWICYLGAFLSGIRPAWWLGSRTWPCIAAITIALMFKFLLMTGVVFVGYLLLGAGLIACILETARVREFP